MPKTIGVIRPFHFDSNYGLPFEDQGTVYYFCSPEHTAKFDMVVFPGGPDVNPALYGEIPHEKTNFDEERDDLLNSIYTIALKKNIPMVGICGGMQFLAVMNGCNLIQHIEGHRNCSHPIYDHATGNLIEVKGDHHQGLSRDSVIDNRGKILANDYPSDIVEACWFPETKCLGVQYHPEWMDKYSDGYRYFQKLINKYV